MGCLSFTAFPRLNFLITKEYKRVKSIYALGDDVNRNFCRQTQLIPEKLYIREYTSGNLRKIGVRVTVLHIIEDRYQWGSYI